MGHVTNEANLSTILLANIGIVGINASWQIYYKKQLFN